MGYNHGLEKKKFDNEWQKNEKLYRELGMTDDQISAIWEFDYAGSVCSAFYRD